MRGGQNHLHDDDERGVGVERREDRRDDVVPRAARHPRQRRLAAKMGWSTRVGRGMSTHMERHERLKRRRETREG